MQKGIICKLTGEVADFENSCDSFAKDPVEAAYQEEQKLRSETIQEAKPAEVLGRLDPHTIERLRQTQDPLFAIVGGLAAALIGAILWAAITVITNFQIGYMAIGVGLIVGFAVRYFGSGVDKVYGIIGAFYALLGCLLGNLFTQIWFLADYQSLGLLNAFKLIDLSMLKLIFQETFSPIDLLFYGIAMAEGYNLAFRKLTVEEIARLNQSPEFIPYPSNHKLRMPLTIAAFAIISILFFALRSETSGQQTYYYESGAKMSEGELKDGVVNGFWTYYNESGDVVLEGNYEDGLETGKWTWYDGHIKTKEGYYTAGMADGVWMSFYPNGQMIDSGSFQNGRKTGMWIIRYENGALAKKGAFIRDKPSGKWLSYYENGKKSAEENFMDGELNGHNLYYNDNGQLTQEIEHKDNKSIIINCWSLSGQQLTINGNGVFEAYGTNGNVLQSGKVKDGIKTGTWKLYHENGNIQAEGIFDSEDTYVINKFWDKAGNLLVDNGNGEITLNSDGVNESGMLVNGYRDGQWKIFNDTGLLSEIMYEKGKFEGTQKSYFPSGSLNFEGYFSGGKKNGLWYWYHENGEVESSVNYVKDQKDGTQEFYNELGIKTREEIYKNGKLLEEKLANL